MVELKAAVAAARREKVPGRQAAAFFEVENALGLPRGLGPMPLASTLSSPQRAFAVACAKAGLTHGVRMPVGSTLRRWLGIDPPSVLEREVKALGGRPVWHALAEGASVETVARSLSTVERFELFAAYGGAVWGYRIRVDPGLPWRSSYVKSLRLSGAERTAAVAWAEATFAANAREPLPPLSMALAFFVLVRAGVVIEPRWDVHLPVGPAVPPWVAVECARALPVERMEKAAAKVLARAGGAHAIERGVMLAKRFGSSALVRAVRAMTKHLSPAERAKVERALASVRPRGVAKSAVKRVPEAPPAVVLRVLARTRPVRASDLTKVQAAQLVAAGKRWDRKSLPVERRLSTDENDPAALGHVLEHVALGDARGKPAYDAWLYAGDGGTFFVAGTTRVVASRIQGGTRVVKGSIALEEALARVEASRGSRRAR